MELPVGATPLYYNVCCSMLGGEMACDSGSRWGSVFRDVESGGRVWYFKPTAEFLDGAAKGCSLHFSVGMDEMR